MFWCIALAGGCVDLSTGTQDLVGTTVPDGELEAVGVINISGGECTGTLITDQVVLAAAHCFCTGATCATTATFTLTNVRPVSNPSIRTNIEFLGATVIAHPDFDIGGVFLANDMAVLRLPQPASSLALVQPIPISTTPVGVGTAFTQVGFGPDNSFGDCAGAQIKRKAPGTVTSVVIGAATGDRTLHFDTQQLVVCHGDSGGPALITDTFGNVVVIGVLSGFDGLKAVSAYLEWIGLQTSSPGNRVAAFDLNGTAVSTSTYADVTPEPDGLIGWIDSNDAQVVGDFFARGNDQVLYVNRGGSGGHLRIVSYADGRSPGESLYWENYGASPLFNDWLDANDSLLAGDFLHRGHDQLLLINRSGVNGRVMIVDFASGTPQVGYLATYANDQSLNGWVDSNDGLLVGDFRGFGYDQVMFINRSGTDGRILVADFHDGIAPEEAVYFEAYSWGVQLNGWHDAGDLLLAGDFTGVGHDEVMFINQAGSGGRVLVADFGDGAFPAEFRYLESYGQSSLLTGWHNAGDTVLAGDFRALGYDQVAFLNRDNVGNGRVLVADFHDGAVPAETDLLQTTSTASTFYARMNSNDTVLTGDVRGTGHTGVVTIERLEQ
jgi:hypothetical protein